MMRNADASDAAFLDDIASLLDTAPPSTLASADDAIPPVATNDGSALVDDLSRLLFDSDSDNDDGAVTRVATLSAPSASRSTVCRMRQREEVEYLKNQVNELESQLSELQQVRWVSCSTLAANDKSFSLTTTTTTAWKRIALHQMSAKQRAEVENMKLRELLDGQLKIARGLEKVLRKRANQQVAEDGFLDTKRRKRASTTDDEIYGRLARKIDARFRQQTAVFEENGMASCLSDLEDARVFMHKSSNLPVVEILYAKVFPFEFASVSAALWKCSTMSYLQLAIGYYTAQAAASNEVKATFELPLQVRRQSVTLKVSVAMKRRCDQDGQREVYAWESLSTLASSHRAYAGIELRDHGWTVVERLSTENPHQPATIVKCCSRLVANKDSAPVQSPIGALNDVMIASYNRNYATLYEVVESSLLADPKMAS